MNGFAWVTLGVSALALGACSGGAGANDASDKSAAIVTDDKAAAAAGGGADGLTLAEYTAVSMAMRDGLDTDSNGSISAAELAVLPDRRRAAWQAYDSDRDGTLSVAEFDAMQAPNFTMRDKNYDRKIMPDEIPDGTSAGGYLF